MNAELKETTSNKQESFGLKEILSKSVKNNIRQYTMVIALLIIWLIFTLITKEGVFLTARNLSTLLQQMCTVGILACGMLMVMVAAHIDLSVGSAIGMLGALAAYLMVNAKVGVAMTLVITLSAGLLVGAWHGFWISYRGVPAFIVTLASMTAFKGVTLGITQGITIGGLPDFFKQIGQGYIPRLFISDPNVHFHDTSAIIGGIAIIFYIVSDLNKRSARKKYGFEILPLRLQIVKNVAVSIVIALVAYVMVSYMGIPYSTLLLLVIVLIFSFITKKTSLGRYIYAIGGNKDAARLSGINIKLTNFLIFLFMGLLNAIAAIVYTARLDAATTSAGIGMELDVIAACIIGGTSTLGGIGTVFGAIIGALVMSSIDNGMSLMNLDILYQYLVKGVILLLAVWVDISTKKKS